MFRTRALIAFFLFASFGVLWSGLALPLSNAPWRLSPWEIGLFGFAGLAGALGAARAGRWADRGYAGPVTVVSLLVLIASWWFTGQAEHSLWLVVVGAVLLDFAVQAKCRLPGSLTGGSLSTRAVWACRTAASARTGRYSARACSCGALPSTPTLPAPE